MQNMYVISRSRSGSSDHMRFEQGAGKSACGQIDRLFTSNTVSTSILHRPVAKLSIVLSLHVCGDAHSPGSQVMH